MDPLNQIEANKIARDYAWNWFELHASQRMQTYNFFLVATAFLIAGFSALLDKHPIAAVGIALTGSWLSVWFNRLDARTRQLVKAAERALKVSDAMLPDPQFRIVEAVERIETGASSYRHVIKITHWTIFWVFVVAAMYAVWTAVHGAPAYME
jgi:hypothetical protein